jgi:hypothetical protein
LFSRGKKSRLVNGSFAGGVEEWREGGLGIGWEDRESKNCERSRLLRKKIVHKDNCSKPHRPML